MDKFPFKVGVILAWSFNMGICCFNFPFNIGHTLNLKTIIFHTNSMGKSVFSQPNKGRKICLSPHVDFGNHVVSITSGHHILLISMVSGEQRYNWICFQDCGMTNDVTDRELGSQRVKNST